MAIARMEKVGRKPMKRLTCKVLGEISTSWPVWLFCATFICHVLCIRIYSYMNLWLKATQLYTTEEVNIILTAGHGTQTFFTLTYAWVLDAMACDGQ
ncbi:hypothetical protein JX265_000780 [Neoarthrinium moseri]|uniref:Uncharacterized protein n=1 Tax=Neoarthrinium moseri TaxID=1658444 RepID=A0A9Q0AUJ5_9PEZI|nr:hypothetical protein JX265_000780 [Neoarthrinium moseri]